MQISRKIDTNIREKAYAPVAVCRFESSPNIEAGTILRSDEQAWQGERAKAQEGGFLEAPQ